MDCYTLDKLTCEWYEELSKETFVNFNAVAKWYNARIENETISYQKIINSWKRCNISYRKNPIKVALAEKIVGSWIKEKENIYLVTKTLEKTDIHYSFKDKKWYNTNLIKDYTIAIPTYHNEYNGSSSTLKKLNTVICNSLEEETNIKIPEWVFTCKDSLEKNSAEIDYDLTENLPTSFLDSLTYWKEQHRYGTLFISDNLLLMFSFVKKSLNINNKNTLDIAIILNRSWSTATRDITTKEFFDWLLINLKKCNQIRINDLKNNFTFDNYNNYTLDNLISELTNCSYYFNNNLIIDTNRTIKYNFETWKTARDNEGIAKQQILLKELNGYNLPEDLIIKIPLTSADLVDEGKQQNNCVGHYYNCEIANGIDLIYLIRRKDKPEKSYITARYHKPTHKTEEIFFKNNTYCNYKTEEIDNLITNILKKEGVINGKDN